MADPTTPPPEPTPPPGEPVAPPPVPADPSWALRLAALAAILAAEEAVGDAFEHLFRAWLPKARKRVFANGPNPDPIAVVALGPEYAAKAAQIADTVLKTVYVTAYRQTHQQAGVGQLRPLSLDGLNFDGHGREQEWLATARNRLVGVPDQVYAMINDRVAKATLDGLDLGQLAAEIDQILDIEGQDRWTNRAMTIARTEAVGAHNAGTYAGHLDLAKQLGGDWDKTWLATHDTRTRETHRRADLQTVPLHSPFTVGGHPAMRPHDPRLPAEELINCRCSLLMHRPGETPDLSNRHLKAA